MVTYACMYGYICRYVKLHTYACAVVLVVQYKCNTTYLGQCSQSPRKQWWWQYLRSEVTNDSTAYTIDNISTILALHCTAESNAHWSKMTTTRTRLNWWDIGITILLCTTQESALLITQLHLHWLPKETFPDIIKYVLQQSQSMEINTNLVSKHSLDNSCRGNFSNSRFEPIQGCFQRALQMA